MRTVFAVAAALMLSAATCAAQNTKDFFPKPQEVAGWAISTEIDTYPGNKIYDFIDGKGEVFVKYNFETVSTAEFKTPEGAEISVEIYKMKTPEDAYGVFSYHRPANAKDLKITQAGYVSGIVAGLWRDTYYVKIQGIEDKPGVADAVGEFAKVISAKIPSEGTLPQYFKVLEVDGFQASSLRFSHSSLALKNLHFVGNDDVLGLDEGSQLIFADYVYKKRSFKAFALFCRTQQIAMNVAARYARALGENPQAEATWYKQTGRVVVGVWAGIKSSETQDAESMMYETIKNILDQIKTYQLEK